mgnify:FL=1
MQSPYLFTSKRLGFRNWTFDDLEFLTKMNSDKEVMKFFPQLLSEEESEAFIHRMQRQFNEYNYCYYATEEVTTQNLIGFVGLAYQDYKAKFNPATDIGWRLATSAWGKGYATEGAQRCLEHGFQELKLPRIVATCPIINKPSENVMKKIGMERKGVYKHPKLSGYPTLEKCVWYEARNQ